MNPFRKFAYSNVWNIGFVKESLEEILLTDCPLSFEFMKHKFKDRWFADPFILKVTDSQIYVLVEEYYNKIKKGRISKLTVNKNTYVLENVETVLQIDTHLSFPAILRDGEKIYIYPENSASGQLKLYEYDETENRCYMVKTLCPEPLTDAVITRVFGEECIMSTQLPDPNKNILGRYNRVGLIRKYVFQDNIARNAGDWFEYKGQWYRPAQDCNRVYGDAVIIQKINIEGTQFKTCDVRRIVSPHPYLKEGCHTFNHFDGVTVIDVKGWWHPCAHYIYENLRKIKK